MTWTRRKKAKAVKLSFKPVIAARLSRTASLGDQFAIALHASDHVTLLETARAITFKLRKRQPRKKENARNG